MKVASLFTGIGGIELGMSQAGLETQLMCEIDPHAKEILNRHFPGTPLVSDVSELRALPKVDVLTAGFPCQDVSQAGQKLGLQGTESPLVSHVFRLLRGRRPPKWVVMENVPYMLRLHRGQFFRHVVDSLEELGYRWAYRVIDARAFGLPQRRPRVILVAARGDADPRSVLFPDLGAPAWTETKPNAVDPKRAYGFYWTEGSRGIGWATDAVPPIKGGSGLGIPSSPAIWWPSRNFAGTLDIRDAERLQGFPADWTLSSNSSSKIGNRWRLVGNAVCVPVAHWLAQRLTEHSAFTSADGASVQKISRERWPAAAWGSRGETWAISATSRPVEAPMRKIGSFIEHELKPLSRRATEGFLRRTKVCTNVVYSEVFLSSLRSHASRVQ